MITCEEVLNNISLYIDNELSLKELEEFEKHIAQCDNCRKELEDIKEMIFSLNNLEEIELPDAYHEELMLKLNNKRNIKWYHIKNFKKYTLAASIFFVFISVALLRNNLQNNEIGAEGFSFTTTQYMESYENNMSRSGNISDIRYNIHLDVENLQETQTIIDNLPGNTIILNIDDTDFKWATLKKDININDYEFIKNELRTLGNIIMEHEEPSSETILVEGLSQNNEEVVSIQITIQEVNN